MQIQWNLQFASSADMELCISFYGPTKAIWGTLSMRPSAKVPCDVLESSKERHSTQEVEVLFVTVLRNRSITDDMGNHFLWKTLPVALSVWVPGVPTLSTHVEGSLTVLHMTWYHELRRGQQCVL
ncbi:hypothetical protein AMECASPLE_033033 [Ameca splendens]|uniref:Uncharacterized protein n=1 Tax=Ameca splendens TaxID=208324 RepID=A0ABV0Z4M6_9TELE